MKYKFFPSICMSVTNFDLYLNNYCRYSDVTFFSFGTTFVYISTTIAVILMQLFAFGITSQ
ncbi:hypothetical protein O3M35_006908 [Rhynocoris fuscipes]|uniref:Uncharacterized protein n=1 Tax=Rhynocoris fuscipes TaxID=488301 RepID=A0AAW1DGU9_9HEMI